MNEEMWEQWEIGPNYGWDNYFRACEFVKGGNKSVEHIILPLAEGF